MPDYATKIADGSGLQNILVDLSSRDKIMAADIHDKLNDEIVKITFQGAIDTDQTYPSGFPISQGVADTIAVISIPRSKRYFNPPNVTSSKSGSIFNYWYTTGAKTGIESNPMDVEEIISTATVLDDNSYKVSSNWSSIKVRIDFDSQGGTGVNYKEVSPNSKISPSTPRRSGFTFVEWNTSSDGSGYTVGSNTYLREVYGDKDCVTTLQLYAIWEQNS